MNKKFSKYNKALFELSLDSRKKRKDICKRLRISPQLLNYIVDSLNKKKITLQDQAIVDPARFGLTNIFTFYSYINFKRSKINEIISYLKASSNVVNVVSLRNGVDLMAEFSVTNLSYFNKINSIFIERFSDSVKVAGIYPVIVKHMYSLNYLHPRSKLHDHIVLSGDREPVVLKKIEADVLRYLIRDPTASIIKISKITKVNPRTVTKILKMFKSERIVRGYTMLINKPLLGISSCNVLLTLTDMSEREMSRFFEYCSRLHEVIEITKVLGNYNLIMNIDSIDSYNPILDRLREEFNIVDYVIYDIKGVLKKSFLPPEVLD